MNDGKEVTVTDAALQEQIGALKEAAAKSIDPCLTAKFIALSDVRVQQTLRKKLIEQGHVLRGIECLNRIVIPENKSVYFNIDCKPGTFCFIKPAFMVVVNIIDGYVVAIVDPFIPSQMNQMSLKGGPGGIPIIDLAPVADRGDVSLNITISIRRNGDEVCAKVKVKVKVEGIGSGTVNLPEVCLGADGVCSSVNSGGGDVRAEAEICWRGAEICAKVTGKIKLFGSWYETTEEKCEGI